MIPKVWEIIANFKELCESKGWKTSEVHDWIRSGEEYHNFVWAPSVSPSTFIKVTTYHQCIVHERLSYKVIDAAYTAWLFSRPPPENVLETVVKDPQLFKKTAIYDLSEAYKGKLVCYKLNETDSRIFEEFEKFLTEKWGIEIKPFYSPSLSFQNVVVQA